MEVYEKINFFLKDKKISKKEFAQRLIALEPKLKNTNEIPSRNSIYAYLNGRIGMKIELIPYVAEVLDIPEQLLFDDTQRARKKFLKYILETLSSEEKDILKTKICNEKSNKQIPIDRFYKIQDLLIYAPEIFLDKLETLLKEYKELSYKFG
ncbi:MAG: hypothetical protein PHX44_05065 [Sulfurimonas sp.]|uniref:hypothetical protein n=1 Tax=Sulfurimonas sp. TaxID=2022749 RepID=UPI002624E131|nr:hypothetical protein [Sulfurimonas sp.]MDD2652406.1 hypothetical protein [Sulfurimonas sp.]MDD3451118.1 hypothetical protein [Sulfurimonas sp.]